MGTGNHQIRIGEHLFLGVDATVDIIAAGDLFAADTPGQQAFALVPAQGVAGVNQWHPQQVGQAHSDVARIRVMAVDYGWGMGLPAQPMHQVIGETVQVIPQLLFRDVLIRAQRDSYDAGTFSQRFFLARVVLVHRVIANKARYQLHPRHIRVSGECTSQVDDVFGLSAGIRVAPQFQVAAANETVNAEQADGDAGTAFSWDRDGSPSVQSSCPAILPV